MKLRFAVALAAAALGASAAVHPPVASAAVDVAANPKLQKLFDSYGNASKGNAWTGGAMASSVRLPDGRTVYVFDNTYLGKVKPNGSRDATTPRIHSSYVVQEKSGALSRTITGPGGTDLFPSPLPNTFYVPAGAVVEGSTIYQTLWLVEADAASIPIRVDVAPVSTTTFAVGAITTNRFLIANTVQPDAQFYPTYYGSAVLADKDYTYVYGYENTYVGFACFAHLARVPAGHFLDGAVEYWDGAAWSAVPVMSARIFGGLNLGQPHFSVVKSAQGYRALTQGYTTSDLTAWTAPTPTGFYKRAHVYTYTPDPAQVTRDFNVPSDAHPIELPQYSMAKKLVFAYLRDGGPDTSSNVAKYRPVFMTGTLS
ncbi:MAG: hypothetical protein JJD92_12450 [Frankiaceae bacterium]|nr:hypothetical protein [Frankiaceae bacterium]